MKQLKFSLLAIATVITFFSCKKNDAPVPSIPKITAGVYVLNEGSGGNNTTITFYDFKTGTPVTDIYKNVNGSGLGDTGNDIIINGSKMYIVMNVSGYLEVADASTAKSIKYIDLKNAGKSIQPRYVVAYKNKVLVSSTDGTIAVVDTTSLSVEKFITAGKNPEQIVVIGDKLFVCNSGGYTPGYDSTISVINLNTLTETSKIVVGTNPTAITTDNNGNIFVGCAGNYGSILPKLVKVDINNNAIAKTLNISSSKLRFYKGMIYSIGYGLSVVKTINPADLSIASANFVTDGTTIITPYALNIDETNGDVYVGDAKDYQSPGIVYCFDNLGKLKFKFSTTPGLNPNTIVFIRK